MLPTVRINAMQAEWMSYTRLDCPAGHKYSPLPVDNWWQKRWLAGSQANPVARLEKKVCDTGTLSAPPPTPPRDSCSFSLTEFNSLLETITVVIVVIPIL